MKPTSHLRALQALDLALRERSLKGAAEKLGITPAAVGQRIRALETYLNTDLLVRGRSGLHPTPELEKALGDLRAAFDALDRVTEQLDFQRSTEIHIVADPDWSALWLEPRLPEFRAENPNVLFCVNGAGDVPMRMGAPDIRVTYGEEPGEPLLTDYLVPVCSPDNLRRIADYDAQYEMEGLPLMSLEEQRDDPMRAGWREWIAQYGLRETGAERGLHYRNARLAIAAACNDVGFAICGFSLLEVDLDAGRLTLPYPRNKGVSAPYPYRLWCREISRPRPQMRAFLDWLNLQTQATQSRIDAMRQ